MDQSSEEYIPGVCNIGGAEIRRRWIVGFTGLAATFVLLVALLFHEAQPPWRLLLIVPATYGAMGFLQARYRFCVYYAARGVQNFGKPGNVKSISESSARRQDRRRMAVIGAAGLTYGIAIALLAYFLPG